MRCAACKEGTIQLGDITLKSNAAGEWIGRVVRWIAPNRRYENCHSYTVTQTHSTREAALNAAREKRDEADWSDWATTKG